MSAAMTGLGVFILIFLFLLGVELLALFIARIIRRRLGVRP